MSKRRNRIYEINNQIAILEQEKYKIEIDIKKKNGVLNFNEAYVVSYEDNGEKHHIVYYHGAEVVCLNAWSDVSSSFCSEMLEEVEKFCHEPTKVVGKKMSLREAIKYL